MTQCFVCRNFKKNILIRAAEGKEKVLCILHMLRIHTGLQKWSKRNRFDLHLKQMNLFNICVSSIKITKSALLFKIYIMVLNGYKYNIEVRNDDAIKPNRIFI